MKVNLIGDKDDNLNKELVNEYLENMDKNAEKAIKYVNEKKDEKEKINNDIINTKSNDDISYFENNYKNKFESPNDVFGLDHQISVKERYNDSNNINLNKINHLSSDMVNLSSNLCMKNNLINKSIDIKGYALESNLTNKTCDQIMMNIKKNSRKKNKIK